MRSRDPHVCNMHLVYDVSNRESFEALPRWLEELENYVPPEVVKIVVGNKLDKVKSSPLITIILSHRPLTRDTHALTHAPHARLGILSTSAHIRRRSVRSADGMSIRRGIRQDGRGRNRGVQRGRRADHRYAFAVE
jgi:GTPase SAR1 family protein